MMHTCALNALKRRLRRTPESRGRHAGLLAPRARAAGLPAGARRTRVKSSEADAYALGQAARGTTKETAQRGTWGGGWQRWHWARTLAPERWMRSVDAPGSHGRDRRRLRAPSRLSADRRRKGGPQLFLPVAHVPYALQMSLFVIMPRPGSCESICPKRRASHAYAPLQ